MAITFSGLGSGIDTGAIVEQLMAAAAVPQQTLKTRVTAQTKQLTALQAINTKIAALADLAKTTATAGAFALHTAKSSNENVAVTAGKDAVAGTYDVRIDAAASTHTIVSSAFTAWPGATPVISVTHQDGTTTEVSTAGLSAPEIAAAINRADGSVSATSVRVGTDPDSGEALYRLQFTARNSGLAGQFTVSQGSVADGTAVDIETLGATRVKTGADAAVTLWAGTGAETTVTSASGTFTGLFPGIDLTASAAAVGSTARIDITDDSTAQTDLAKKLVDAVNGILTSIATYTAVTASSGTSGSSTTAGILVGDSVIRSARSTLLDAATRPLTSTTSLSTLGIQVTRDGQVEFDAEKFAAALEADPTAVQTQMTDLAARVQTAATAFSDKYDGQLTNRITSVQGVIDDLGDDIARWDDKLAQRRQTLSRTYSQLETTLAMLKSQSAAMAAQLGTLSSSN
jgi:flagellar hook-associated protein 2